MERKKLSDLGFYFKKLMPERFPQIEKMISRSERQESGKIMHFIISEKHNLNMAYLNRQCGRNTHGSNRKNRRT